MAVLARTASARNPGTVVPDLLEALEARGWDARHEDPDRGSHDLSSLEPDADLYVLKSGTETALSYAGALHAGGARIINPWPVAMMCRDKIVQTRVLEAAGVPLPQSWVTTEPRELEGELGAGPLILKDPRGSQGRGLHIVREASSLACLGSGSWLAMRYHEPEGADLKLYRIGEELFCVERCFPARTYAEKVGRLRPVTPELERIVRACGEPFGIEVYGVDVIRHGGRLWVVDMSAFPGFKGVPHAGARIAARLGDPHDHGALLDEVVMS